MAINDLSFKFYEELGLTTLVGSFVSFAHKNDLSDNPQDLQLFFGSNTSSRILEHNAATGTPGTDPITLTPADNVPSWAASTAYTIGQVREPVTPNGYRYRVKVSGTSGASEPTWPTSGIGSTVSDGTVVWEFIGPKHAVTEIKLALTQVGLDSAVAGASLDLATEIESGSANAVSFWIRVTNAVTVISTGRDLMLSLSDVQERVIA